MDETHAHYPIEFLLLEYLLQDKHLFILYLYILSFNYIIITISDILITSQHKAIVNHVNFCIFPFTVIAFAMLKMTNAMCIISKTIASPPKIFARNSALLGTSYYIILCLIFPIIISNLEYIATLFNIWIIICGNIHSIFINFIRFICNICKSHFLQTIPTSSNTIIQA